MTKRIDANLESRVIHLLRDTNKCLAEIGREIGIHRKTVKKIQNKTIEEGLLKPGHKRLYGKVLQYHYDKVLEHLSTDKNLSEIGGEIGVSYGTVKNIQDKIIQEGMLDSKYRRLAGGIVQYKREEALKLLSTKLYLKEISKKTGLSFTAIRKIRNEAIEEGRLKPSYKRKKPTRKKQCDYETFDKSVKLLSNTNKSLTKIGEEVELSTYVITNIQNKAIKKGQLDLKYKRLSGGLTQCQYNKVLDLLVDTNLTLKKINRKIGITTARNIQNRAIEEGKLNPKYKRLPGGLLQYHYDKVLDLLINTNLGFTKIGKEVGISTSPVIAIQNKAIAEGKLDLKYRRVSHRIIQYQYDKVLDLLTGTNLTLSEISKKVVVGLTGVRNIQNRAIEEGRLDLKYKRLAQGIIQYQHNKVLELLTITDKSLKKISEKVGISSTAAYNIYNKALKEGKLDPKYRRTHESNFSKLLYAYVKS